jgi:hypothetical protein
MSDEREPSKVEEKQRHALLIDDFLLENLIHRVPISRQCRDTELLEDFVSSFSG